VVCYAQLSKSIFTFILVELLTINSYGFYEQFAIKKDKKVLADFVGLAIALAQSSIMG
jgi:hypothetical protein